jgi:hypothetical protein
MLDDPNRELGERLLEILMPYARSRLEAVKERRGRFVHYTSAESALKIIQSKTMWMRNTRCMNDYSELQHGQEVLSDLPEMKRLTETIKSLPVVGEAALKAFGVWWTDSQPGTYITSISEHDDTEDIHGRLSMWRAVSRSAAGRTRSPRFLRTGHRVADEPYLQPGGLLHGRSACPRTG